MKYKSFIIYIISFFACTALVTSCDDMLQNDDSDFVIYADQPHLNTPADTVNSVLGILNKLQGIAVRTNLLGELRGDLVKVNNSAHIDLKSIASFEITDDNQYNNPRDYYAVINNCNYFLAFADTALTNNRNEKIFEKEYAAVSSIRAWTYLQLVLNYGRVPLVTTPILTELDSQKDYPMKDLVGICDYFVKDLIPYQMTDLPNYGSIDDRVHPRLCFFPVHLVMADMMLWRGAYTQNPEDSYEAALYYYKYLTNTYSYKSRTYTGTKSIQWSPNALSTGEYYGTYDYGFSSIFYSGAVKNNVGGNNELITVIPMDSAANDGYYNQLRTLYYTTEQNDYQASISPSDRLFAVSKSQVYCGENQDGAVVYPTEDDYDLKLLPYSQGDLRLMQVLSTSNQRVDGVMRDLQRVSKADLQDVYIYRTGQIYLRMAEALNHAGYPRFAFEILNRGINNTVIEKYVLPYCGTEIDTARVRAFDFPIAYFPTEDVNANNYNTIGLHSRGSGTTYLNEYYLQSAYKDSTHYPKDKESLTFKEDSTIWAENARLREIELVDSLIDNEQVLELCFEGNRYYDLMRMAMRKNDPSYLAERVSKRHGEESIDTRLYSVLMDQRNWYLSWKNQIGF